MERQASAGVAALAALPMGFIGYFPTILVLWFLDRREREPKLLFWGTVFALIFFVTPVASRFTRTLADALGITPLLIVGFSEDFWKVAPLLLLVSPASSDSHAKDEG